MTETSTTSSHSAATVAAQVDPPPRIDPGAAAISAVLLAGAADAATAVMGAVDAFANAADDSRAALDEVHRHVVHGASTP